MTRLCLGRWIALLVCLFSNHLATSALAQGIALQGVGPVNRSMAGASTAAPLDAAGALLWNPATISGLPQSEVTFGMELLLPHERLSSRIEAGAFGGGFPPATMEGSTSGEPGVSPIPTVGWVHKSCDDVWTFGLGMFGVAGFRVNYPASTTNPILMPQGTADTGGFGGLGRVFAELEVLQIVPTASVALTDRLSIGVAPVISLARLATQPLLLAPPDDADGDGFARYPSGLGTRYHFGSGAQIGIYYIADGGVHLGASIKSPQWFERFRFQTTDEAGEPRVVARNINYPMIVSLGMAYSGIERLVVAVDTRYFDYKNTDGFRSAEFAPDGRVTGLGWSNIFSVSTGVQYQVGDRLLVRGGYTYQQNPIGSEETVFNIQTPLILEHVVSCGASYHVTPNVTLNAAYIHAFENETTGPYVLPGTGPIPGTSITSRISADALAVGATIRY